MTPYAHHQTDDYLTAYRAEIAADMQSARNGPPLGRQLRTSIARTVVRFGAWILPEGPEVVDGRIIVLPSPKPGELTEAA